MLSAMVSPPHVPVELFVGLVAFSIAYISGFAFALTLAARVQPIPISICADRFAAVEAMSKFWNLVGHGRLRLWRHLCSNSTFVSMAYVR